MSGDTNMVEATMQDVIDAQNVLYNICGYGPDGETFGRMLSRNIFKLISVYINIKTNIKSRTPVYGRVR